MAEGLDQAILTADPKLQQLLHPSRGPRRPVRATTMRGDREKSSRGPREVQRWWGLL